MVMRDQQMRENILEVILTGTKGEWISRLYRSYEENVLTLGQHLAQELQLFKVHLRSLERAQENLAYTLKSLEGPQSGWPRDNYCHYM